MRLAYCVFNPMNKYKDLNVWKESIELASDIYRITNEFPDHERFGLIQQLRRAVISVSSNIAEGSGRNNAREFYHFLGIAAASACEVESQLIVASKLGMINKDDIEAELDRVDKIQKMIFRLQSTI